MKIYCDGGLKEICVVYNDQTIIQKVNGTNNENEYRAMLLSLSKAKDGDTIYSDSMLIVMQTIGRWKLKAHHLFELHEKAKQLYKSKNVKIEWISRDWNKAGWVLEGNTSNYKKEKYEFLQ